MLFLLFVKETRCFILASIAFSHFQHWCGAHHIEHDERAPEEVTVRIEEEKGATVFETVPLRLKIGRTSTPDGL